MNSFPQRLAQIMGRHGIPSVAKLAEALGYARSERVRKVMAGESLPSFGMLEDIARVFATVDMHWLVTGEEGPKTGGLAGSAKPPHTSPRPTEIDGNIIALRSKVAAGLLRHRGQQEFLDKQPRMSLPGQRFQGGGLLAIQVTGDSMEPTILDGDWLVVRKCDNPREQVRPGHIYVVVTVEGASAKRLRIDFAEEVILCESDNPDVASYTITDKEAAVYDVLALLRENPGDQRYSINARLVRVEQDVAKLKKR